MFVDGKAIAADILAEAAVQAALVSPAPTLAIITCDPNQATKQYLALKQDRAQAAGIAVSVTVLPAAAETNEVIAVISDAVTAADAVIVQLPLPFHIDTDAVLRAIPTSHDVDGLTGVGSTFLSPVVEACRDILERHGISPAHKRVVVVGSGRLVGAPVARWFTDQGARVEVVTDSLSGKRPLIRSAEILVLGAGQPGFISPDMLQPGVVVLDAGTSEQGGKILGDADPACAKVASIFTPVPGGIGPITVSALLRNVVLAAQQNRKVQ